MIPPTQTPLPSAHNSDSSRSSETWKWSSWALWLPGSVSGECTKLHWIHRGVSKFSFIPACLLPCCFLWEFLLTAEINCQNNACNQPPKASLCLLPQACLTTDPRPVPFWGCLSALLLSLTSAVAQTFNRLWPLLSPPSLSEFHGLPRFSSADYHYFPCFV